MVINAWNRLLRLPNLVLLAFCQFILYRFLILPFFHVEEVALNGFQFGLLVFTFCLVCASGNVINAIYDIKIDQHHPDRSIIPDYFSKIFCIRLYAAFILLGALISLYLAISLNQLMYWWMYPLSVGGLWFYSFRLKCFPLLGNLLVSFFIGMSILFIPFAFFENLVQLKELDYKLWAVIQYRFIVLGVFAILVNLIRELVKDIEDQEADGLQNCKSTAVFYGQKQTKWFVLFCMIAMGLLIFFDFYFQTSLQNRLYNGFLLLLPYIYILIKTIHAQSIPEFNKLSRLLKLFMFNGMILYSLLYEF